jgi:small subunit ribosomal protein S20
VYALANIKSAKKRILVNETKAARNKAIKSKVKTAVKKVEAAVAAKDAETAKTALRAAIVEISKAGTKGVYHKKTVSRKISRLSNLKATANHRMIHSGKVDKNRKDICSRQADVFFCT